MKKIVVLGAGRVGKAIAIDLKSLHQVVSVDINEDELNDLSSKHNIDVVKSDLSKPENIKKNIKNIKKQTL